MSPKMELFSHVLSAPQKALIEKTFKDSKFTTEDVDDFFDPLRMRRRFARELVEIRAERTQREAMKHREPETD